MGRDPYVTDKWHELSDWSSQSRSEASSNQTRLKSIEIQEAADVFGDLQTAEDYGYVNRGFVHHCRHDVSDMLKIGIG